MFGLKRCQKFGTGGSYLSCQRVLKYGTVRAGPHEALPVTVLSINISLRRSHILLVLR